MLRRVKAFLRARPRLYDAARRFDPRRPPGRAFLRAFSRSRNGNVTFLQIGAGDGLCNDPVREFVVGDHWTGVFVEPLPDVFELLRRNYGHLRRPDLVFVNAAVSSSDGGSLSFWTFRDDFLQTLSRAERLNCLQKSSLHKEVVLEFVQERSLREDVLLEIRVPCLSVHAVIERYWDRGAPDVLVIDAEGHEPAIFSGIDFKKWSPRAIFFESHHLGPAKPAVFQLLTNAGYHITEMGGDTGAVLGA